MDAISHFCRTVNNIFIQPTQERSKYRLEFFLTLLPIPFIPDLCHAFICRLCNEGFFVYIKESSGSVTRILLF